MKDVHQEATEIVQSAQKNSTQNIPASRKTTYQCVSCQDTGYLGWKTPHAGYPVKECAFCECEKGQKTLDYWKLQSIKTQQKQLDSIFSNAGIPAHFRGFTIESMVERCAKDPGKKEAIATVKSFIENGYVEDSMSKRYKNGLVLSGDFGRGKTGLLTPALRSMLESGKSGLWIETYDFISEIQSGYEDGSSLKRLEAAQRADVILLDDFGDKSRTNAESDDRRRIIYQLINYRHNNGLPMLITSNLTAAEMSMQFGQRTVERIIESCAWVKVGGDNLRLF